MQNEYTPSGEVVSQKPSRLTIRRRKSAICDQCGCEFKPKLRTQRFCSRPCQTKWFIPFVAQSSPLREAKAAAIRTPDNEYLQLAESDDDSLWALRAKYWEFETERTSKTKSDLDNNVEPSEPLILSGYGVSLKIRHGALVARDGNTHYPQAPREITLFPGDWRLPSRIVLLDTSGSVSVEVIQWLSDYDIPLIILNWEGQIITITGRNGNTIDATFRNIQCDALNNGTGLNLAMELISQKIAASKNNIVQLVQASKYSNTIEKLDRCLLALKQTDLDASSIRLIEAQAAQAYFASWLTMPIKWKKRTNKPIPPTWTVVGHRESLLSGTNRNATHPVNAILNYSYRVLESQILIAASISGVDPTIGYLHARRPNRSAFVYDLMEPLRPMVDRQVLEMVRSHTFSVDDFPMTNTGLCRLHPDLAKRIVKSTVTDEQVMEVVQLAKIYLKDHHTNSMIDQAEK